jgi:hypothetical protein
MRDVRVERSTLERFQGLSRPSEFITERHANTLGARVQG